MFFSHQSLWSVEHTCKTVQDMKKIRVFMSFSKLWTFEISILFSSKVPNAFLLFQGCKLQHCRLQLRFHFLFLPFCPMLQKIKIESALSALSALLSLVFGVLACYSETRRTRSISEMGCSIRYCAAQHMFPDGKTPVQSTWQNSVILQKKKIKHQFVFSCAKACNLSDFPRFLGLQTAPLVLVLCFLQSN